jgi:protein ImuB
MLWLALHLPWLPLEALPIPASTARCVIEQRRVLLASRAARAAGVEPGMSASTAASLAPQVQQLVREPVREAEFVRALALALARYTPQIVLQTDGVLLEVEASLRLFGGLRALLRALRGTLRDCEAHARIAIAPTAAAASLLARVAPGRALRLPRTHRLLDALPLPPVLAALQQEQRLAELLQAIGCQTLAELRALPRAGVQRRGGRALLHALARAYGDLPDPQRWFEPPQQFVMGLELMHRADNAAKLVFAFQRLVQPLAGWLASQWLAASRLSLRLRHERGRRTEPDGELVIELGAPSRDASQIMTLLRERLQRFQLAAPVYAIELRLDEAVSCPGSAGQLLPDPGQQAQDFQALLDRLASRLGRERVLRLSTADDHRPERASVAVSALEPPPRALAAAGLPRPVWLLPQPLRLSEHAGQPVHGGVLTLLSRAERIEAGWFDGALVCRDYHVAEGIDHRLRWIYRERGGEAWYLHGLFA